MADDDSGDELVIDATSLLNLGEPDPVPEVVLPALPNTLDDIREDSNTPTGHLSTSQSEPTLPSANGVLETGSKALERKNSVLGDLSVFSEKGGKTRGQRRSLGKRSLTLSGNKRSADMSIKDHVKHLERNFSNILMLVSRSLDTLTEVLTKNKGKGEQEKAIAMGQKLTKDVGDVNVVITKATNMCDGKTKVATPALIPDTVDEALITTKHILNALLPKFNKFNQATRDNPDYEDKIEKGLLDEIDLLMSDAAEQMDRLGIWLKESGFGDAAGAIMMAMRWKRKAFGGGTGRAGFGSVRLPAGRTSFSPTSSVQQGSDVNDIVANALTDGKAAALEEAVNLPDLDAVKKDETPPDTTTAAAANEKDTTASVTAPEGGLPEI